MLTTQDLSPKSGLTAYVLCMFLGVLGIHRFYVGKIGTGILMLLTFGGLGFWAIYDLLSIVCKNFTDSQGRTVEVVKNPTAPRNIIIVVICVYILIVGSAALFGGKTVRQIANVGKDELAALRAGNIEQAYAYTSADFQKGVNVDQFKNFVASYPQLHDNVDSTFSNIEFKDNNGAISGTLNMKNGVAVPVDMGLVNENGQWKVNEINIKKTAEQSVTPVPVTEAPVQTTTQAPANPVSAPAPAPAAPVASTPLPTVVAPVDAAPAQADQAQAPAQASTVTPADGDQTPATASKPDANSTTQDDKSNDSSSSSDQQ
jgi:hypothetical protein